MTGLTPKPPREGEVTLDFTPGAVADASIEFIGRIRTPWSPGDAPRNMTQAREHGGDFRIELRPEFVQGLSGLEVGRHVILLYWMDQARRDIILQKPGHTEGPRGPFALRSPVRPNPVSLATVRITSLDMATGVIGVDAVDCFDGTPLVDIKPWLPTIDVPPEVAR